MKNNYKYWIMPIALALVVSSIFINCKTSTSENAATLSVDKRTPPSDVIPFMDKWKILLGDGTRIENLKNYQNEDYFYTVTESNTNWVVYKTPNAGITSRTSSNTRTELGEKKRWLPKTGGRLTGVLKVMHVSTSGDARAAASYSVVVGQIHSDDSHENEPIKIFYKKFPGHDKGSVFWNYEINTKGDNSKRWDFSTAVWGYDMSVIGSAPSDYPEEPADGISLGEEFGYEINVYQGIMYLTFTRDGHEAKTFTKSLINSEYQKDSDIPQQIRNLYSVIGRDGTEKANAYKGEVQYFKQGAYNQTNGKKIETNMVWSTESEIYDGDITKQYANGSYTEVWFKNATIGPANKVNK